jgi:hypothetical protein
VAAFVALGVAVLALAISSAGVWALLAWRQNRRALATLTERLAVDSRIEALTVQTLASMRDAVRRAGGQR